VGGGGWGGGGVGVGRGEGGGGGGGWGGGWAGGGGGLGGGGGGGESGGGGGGGGAGGGGGGGGGGRGGGGGGGGGFGGGVGGGVGGGGWGGGLTKQTPRTPKIFFFVFFLSQQPTPSAHHRHPPSGPVDYGKGRVRSRSFDSPDAPKTARTVAMYPMHHEAMRARLVAEPNLTGCAGLTVAAQRTWMRCRCPERAGRDVVLGEIVSRSASLPLSEMRRGCHFFLTRRRARRFIAMSAEIKRDRLLGAHRYAHACAPWA